SGKSEEAIKLFNDSLKKSREKSELYFNLGVTSLATGEISKAVTYFEKSIASDKTKAKSYANLIHVLNISDDVRKAEYYLNMAPKNMVEDIDIFRNASALYQRIVTVR